MVVINNNGKDVVAGSSATIGLLLRRTLHHLCITHL
jgi:hypothetical protein